MGSRESKLRGARRRGHVFERRRANDVSGETACDERQKEAVGHIGFTVKQDSMCAASCYEWVTPLLTLVHKIYMYYIDFFKMYNYNNYIP